MRTKGIGNRKKNKCRTGKGNASWGNSDLDCLEPGSAFVVSCIFSLFFQEPPFPSSLRGHESSKLHKIIIVFFLFLFLVISPAGTEAEPVPYYCAIFALEHCRSTCVSCAEISTGKSKYVLQQRCSPPLQGHQRLTGPFPKLLLSSAVALALYAEIFP